MGELAEPIAPLASTGAALRMRNAFRGIGSEYENYFP